MTNTDELFESWYDNGEYNEPNLKEAFVAGFGAAEAALSEAQKAIAQLQELRQCDTEMINWAQPRITQLRLKNDELTAQIAQLQTTISQLTEALQNYVDAFGGLHEEECPADDTCDCKWKPMNNLTNAALVHAQEKP